MGAKRGESGGEEISGLWTWWVRHVGPRGVTRVRIGGVYRLQWVATLAARAYAWAWDVMTLNLGTAIEWRVHPSDEESHPWEWWRKGGV